MSTAPMLVDEARSAAYWDRHYWHGGRSLHLGSQERQLLRIYSQVEPGQFAVDVGCGRGSLAAVMNAWGLNVLGLDMSEVAIEAARGTFQEYPHLRFDQMDITADSVHPMLRPGAVDLITCRLTLPYLDRPRFFGDARRWLKPGTGTLVVTTGVEELAPPVTVHRSLTLAEVNALGDDHWQHVTRYPITVGGSVQCVVLRGPIR
ncbi:class I SAM-dependent methyltransferase [Streptomyces sp. NPDC090442]|uniref:class I SAM-dependent methyltransferase n=1 Tax=Streptomyces sp. NPDC090442 TaxID=3365962 RepID=UPI0037F99E03